MFFLVASFVDIDIRSRGCDDPGNHSSVCGSSFIKVHGNNYAPRRKGHNIVIVDAKTGMIVLGVTPKYKAQRVPVLGTSQGVQPQNLHSGSLNGTEPREDNVLF